MEIRGFTVLSVPHNRGHCYSSKRAMGNRAFTVIC